MSLACLQAKLQEKTGMTQDAETRIKDLEAMVREAEERWSSHEQHEVSDVEKALAKRIKDVEVQRDQLRACKAQHQVGETHPKIRDAASLAEHVMEMPQRHKARITLCLEIEACVENRQVLDRMRNCSSEHQNREASGRRTL